MRKLNFMPIAAVATLGAVFAIQSCNKIASKLHYDLPLQTGSIEVTIPPTSDTTSQALMGTGTNHYNIDSFIKANTANVLGVNNITSVKLTSVKLTLENATTANNFANFSYAYASFYSNSNTTPYQVSIPNNPDTYADTLSLPVNPNDELKGYMTGTTFYYSVGGKLRRPVTDSVKCKVEFKFNVTVNG